MKKAKVNWHVWVRSLTGVAMTLALVLGIFPAALNAASAAPGAEKPQGDLGYPIFRGDKDPIPATGVAYDPSRSYLEEVFAEDLANGAGSPGKDFWIDRMLGRDGAMYDATESAVAFTRGRAVFMKTHQPNRLGWVGDTAYWESLGASAFEITAFIGDSPISLVEDRSLQRQTPSYFHSVFVGGGIRVIQDKFITQENVMVANLRLESLGESQDVKLRVTSPLAAGTSQDELVGEVAAFNDLTRVYTRLSGDGFAVVDKGMETTVSVPSAGEVSTKVQLGMITEELPESQAEYEEYRSLSPADAYTQHVTDYNQWWVDNMVYLDTPENNIDKTLFYRWWLLRFNYLDANIPGNDYQFPTSMEGVLGYNNSIVLTVGMFIDDLKYFRDPTYAFGPALSAGETSKSYKFVDNPGDPENWDNSYTQYITEAAWRAYQVHGGPGKMGAPLAKHSEYDVNGLLDAYDGNNNGLIEYSWGAMTGNDADAVSLHWREGQKLDRAENAYLYSNARGAAKFYEVAGDNEGMERMAATANKTRSAVLENLWEDATDGPGEMGHKGNLLKHRVAGGDKALVPWKELNNYYPFNVGLMPRDGDPDYDPKYVEALRLFADADEYPVFPFFTANQRDKKVSKYPNENNFSVINSTVLFNTYSSALRDYPSEYITPEMYKQLLYWNAFAHYQGGDNSKPNQNEFWNTAGTTNGGFINYRSWIHHTILGTTNFTVIEDVAGLQPREDNKLELSPIVIPGWDYFTANNVRYHGQDLTIVWDKDGQQYGGPAGYSAYLDGKRLFTANTLAPVVYDPETGTVDTRGDDTIEITMGDAAVLDAAPSVSYSSDSRIVDVFAKAGTDIDPVSLEAVNVAQASSVTASYTAPMRDKLTKERDPSPESTRTRVPESAVNGDTINEPFWGTAGTPNMKDSLEVDFGEVRTINDVRVYFYRTSSSATERGYAAPELYVVEYWDGDKWQSVPDQARTPQYAAGNLNRIQFSPVETPKIRLTVKHAAGFATGVKEIQAFHNSAPLPASTNAAPSVKLRVDETFSAPNRARIIGNVADDGLPMGELNSKWSVVSAPEGGEVVFDDDTSATTTVQFTELGEYTLRLTASDGEKESYAEVTVLNDSGEMKRTNVAPQAKASANRTAGHNNVAAVNDGKAVFPVANESDAWGTWGTSEPWYVDLTWDTPQRLNGSSVMFHDNGAPTGMLTPKSWSLQYLSEDGTWKDVDNPSGFPTATGVFNTVSFDAVTTTALRIIPVRNGQSFPGIIEWEAYLDEPTTVEPVGVFTRIGEAPELPGQVELLYSNGERTMVPVQWQSIAPEQYAVEGKFQVYGFPAGASLLAKAIVNVKQTFPGQVNTIDHPAVTTTVGIAPSLPATVMTGWNDGSQLSLKVAWAEIDPAKYSQVGEFIVTGTLVETDALVEAKVTVVADPSIRPQVAITVDPDPVKAGWHDGPVTVAVTAKDLLDENPLIEINVTGEWIEYSKPVIIEREGVNTVYARAKTADGRESSQVAQDINIDTTSPLVEATFDSTSRYLTIAGTDSGSGVGTVEYSLNDKWEKYTKPVLVEDEATVRFRATDVVGNSSAEKSIEIGVPASDWVPNIAPTARATASASAPWNSAAGLNDGVVEGDQSNYWGTYGVEGEVQWAQLEWDEPREVSSSKVLFFDDGGGMDVPSSWVNRTGCGGVFF